MKLAILFCAGLLGLAVAAAPGQDLVPGKVYFPREVHCLVGQDIPAPTYLVGTLRCAVVVQGMPMFEADHGRVIVHVKCLDGQPALARGATLCPDTNDPLAIVSVTHSRGDRFVFVEAEAARREP